MVNVLPSLSHLNGKISDMVEMNTYATWMIVIGLVMVITGFLHLNSVIVDWDAHTFQWIHIRLRRFSNFFQYIRPLGTVPVGILLTLIIFISSWQAGIVATLTYLFSSIIERTIKMFVRRPRPFAIISMVKIGQLPIPDDPSHPSGDSLRVWLFALLFPLAFALPYPVYAISILFALVLSVGRIALGVHYPLDVIGGAGLGILSAGFAVISYQFVLVN
jgi:undecaprenyl-diphosphatase